VKTYLVAYVATGLAFLLLDALWLSKMGPSFYKPIMGDAALEGFRIAPAIVFYFLYLIGIMVFAITPALDDGRWTTAMLYGALLGFFCYATYDLTNQATLKNWTTALSMVDIAWGTFASSTAATIGFLAADFLDR
jgi:uncharacterized membrane protein